MSQPNQIELGLPGEEIILTPNGREYTEKTIEISREDRTASGRLVKDIIAKKKGFTLAYETISKSELDKIDALYALDQKLRLFVYFSTTQSHAYNVMLKPYDKTRILAISDSLWGNVTIEMEEV